MDNTDTTATTKLDQLIAFTVHQSPADESWREVMIDDSYYFISSLGRVLSLQRLTPHIMTPQLQRDGYYYVDLKENRYRINRLVAMAFLDNPKKKPIVHHKDGNKLNNRADNLEWLTYAEHSKKHSKTEKDK